MAGGLLSSCDSLEFALFLDSSTVIEDAKVDDGCDWDFVFAVSSEVEVEGTPSSLVVVEMISTC